MDLYYEPESLSKISYNEFVRLVENGCRVLKGTAYAGWHLRWSFQVFDQDGRFVTTIPHCYIRRRFKETRQNVIAGHGVHLATPQEYSVQ